MIKQSYFNVKYRNTISKIFGQNGYSAPCGCRTTVSVPAFQAGDEGSIPSTRSILFSKGDIMLTFECTVDLGKGRITSVTVEARNINDARKICEAQYGNCIGLFQVNG